MIHGDQIDKSKQIIIFYLILEYEYHVHAVLYSTLMFQKACWTVGFYLFKKVKRLLCYQSTTVESLIESRTLFRS